MNLVRVPTHEEQEYLHLTLHISWRTDQIASLQAELNPIQAAFEAFEWEYTQRVGHLISELNVLRATTQKIEQKTARIHARMASDPGGVLGDLFDQDELREIGEMFGIDVPDEWFANARKGRESAGDDWDWAEFASAEEELIREMQRNRSRRMPEEETAELKRRYRDLARRFHPDLADSSDERAMRQEIMLRINHAWQCQDLEALRALEHELETRLPGWSASHWEHRVAWARRECERLDREARGLMRRLRQLRNSETFPLWFNSTLGRTVISQRANATRRELDRQRERHEDARDAFRQALAHYAAAIA